MKSYTKKKFAIDGGVLMALLSLLLSPALQHETEDVCFANDNFVSIDCMRTYEELLRPVEISDILFVTHDVSPGPVQGKYCDADELHIRLSVEDSSTGSSVPFQTVAILLIPMSENHRAAELPRGIHSRIYDASFMNGVYGERINCFRPESSIILMSYGDTPVSKNTVSITLKTLPGVEWMEIFVQFKIEPDTVVEDVIYFEYLSPDYYEEDSSFIATDDSLPLPKGEDVQEINTEEHSVRKRAEPRPVGFLANMSRTELRRGRVRFTARHGDSRKFGHILAPHPTHSNETFTLTHSRRGHPHRGHIANNAAASVRHFISSSDAPKPPSSVFDIIASKRGRPRWQATHDGQRSFKGIQEHEDPADMTLLKLRRGPHRFAIRSNNTQQNRQLHLSQHDPLSHIVHNENTELVELRRGHAINKKLPGHRGRGLAATAGEESHEPDDGPFHLTQAKRGHKAVKYKPTLGHRSIHLHTPEDSKAEFNASLVQIRRGAKQRTKQDKLKLGDMFPPSAIEARPTKTRDMFHLPSGRGVMPIVSKPSPTTNETESKTQSKERKTKTKTENTKKIKDKDSATKAKSASSKTKSSKPRKSYTGSEPKAGMTRLHLERIGADYIPKPVLIFSGCGKEYSCFNYPKDCHKSKKCAVAMSYRVDENGRLHVVLLAVKKNYVAVGFSKDKLMGDEAVVTCKRIPGSTRVAIWKSYNIAGSGLNSRNNQVETNHTDVEPISGAVYKGVITCDFTLPMVMKSGRSTKTDFKNGKYYILLATGVNNKEPHGPGSITYHGFSVSSSIPISLTSKSTIASSPASNYFMSVHIFLAILTYGFFMPLAIIMARYGQEAYPHKSVKALPKWVIIHLIFQGLAILCNTVSTIFAFLGRSGASIATFSSFYHFAMGICITVLPLVNAALGLLIHSKKSKEKVVMPALRTAHYLFGHVTFAVGAVELIRGPYLPKSVASCSVAILAGYWVLFYALANLLLMFNTDYLRRLQGKKAPACRAFIGPAIQLDLDGDRSHYDVRRGTIVFMFFIALFFTVSLCILFALSPTGCRQGVPDYI